MSWRRIYRVVEDFDGKFTAYTKMEHRGWFPSALVFAPPETMGPYDTEEEALKAMAYLKSGPRIVAEEVQ